MNSILEKVARSRFSFGGKRLRPVKTNAETGAKIGPVRGRGTGPSAKTKAALTRFDAPYFAPTAKAHGGSKPLLPSLRGETLTAPMEGLKSYKLNRKKVKDIKRSRLSPEAVTKIRNTAKAKAALPPKLSIAATYARHPKSGSIESAMSKIKRSANSVTEAKENILARARAKARNQSIRVESKTTYTPKSTSVPNPGASTTPKAPKAPAPQQANYQNVPGRSTSYSSTPKATKSPSFFKNMGSWVKGHPKTSMGVGIGAGVAGAGALTAAIMNRKRKWQEESN